MPAPKFLAGLPKPVLFGFYGALGGLLGALAFGELVWFLLRPPPPKVIEPPPPPPQLALTASPQVAVYPGTDNTIGVQIARDRFDGPVLVSFGTAPGVSAKNVTIPAGQTAARADLSATKDAAPGTVKLDVFATSANPELRASAQVEVAVTPLPPAPPRLAVSTSPRIQVYQRGKNRFSVQVARGGFDGDVRVEFENLPADVSARAVTVPAGTTEAPVELLAGPAAPLGTFQIRATARATPPQSGPQPVELVARGGSGLEVLAAPQVPVDIVFVLDVTGSMGAFITGVKDGIKDFATQLTEKKVDARVALLAFRDLPGGEPSQLLRFGDTKEPFTTDTEAFKEKVGALRADGGGDTPESSLDALVEASELKYRGQVTRVLLLITDAPPKLPDQTTRTVAECVEKLKKQGIDQVHLVTRPADLRAHYRPLLDGFKGKHYDRSRVTRGEKFAEILPELGRAIAELVAEKPSGKLDLPGVPPPPALPAATDAKLATTPALDAPPPVLPPTVKSVQSTEVYDATKKGRLVLAVGVWTGAIAALVCLALVAGQHHYLRGALPPVGGALAALGGGLLVGVLGGAAGQGLLLAAESELFRVLGWALLGALAGAGLALFVPNLKVVYGLLGGALGGTVGALAFVGVGALTGDTVGRLAGGLLLGACIGLMLALVEKAFRSAWLEVSYGPRETVQVNLGTEPVKIGGDAKACTVWARGAAPIALRFFVRNGQVICEDAVNRTESAVGDGTERRAGSVSVVVRTGRGAPAPAGAPKAPAPPPKPRARTDDEDLLPMDAVPAKPVAPAPAPKPTASKPALPPVPPAPSKPALPPVPPKGPPPAPKAPAPPTGSKPNIARGAPGGCPGCGRAISGEPGKRYCMVCDATF
jgi:Mg-chelatase subunit ChlD